MAHVLIPLPNQDHDPTEVAVPWRLLTARGPRVSFATPDGQPAEPDDLMLTGKELDPWGRVPGLRGLPLLGLVLRADAEARRLHAALRQDPAYRAPLRWDALQPGQHDALLLPGGHRARGMRAYLESPALQALVAAAFAANQPVGAICHGALLAARSRGADGRSVLHGRRTTALTWPLERSAAQAARVGRFWDPHYYRTYLEAPGEPAGWWGVQQEVTRALASPADFLDVPADAPHHWRKASGLVRDRADDERPAWVVRDGRYVSARWPGDAHTFAKVFAEVLAEVA